MQYRLMTDNIAWVEIARRDNDRLEIGELDSDGLENDALEKLLTAKQMTQRTISDVYKM